MKPLTTLIVLRTIRNKKNVSGTSPHLHNRQWQLHMLKTKDTSETIEKRDNGKDNSETSGVVFEIGIEMQPWIP